MSGYKVIVSAPVGTSVSQSTLDALADNLSLRANSMSPFKVTLGEEEFTRLLHTTVETYFADNVANIGKIELKGEDGSYAAYDVLGWTLTNPTAKDQTTFIPTVGKTVERPVLTNDPQRTGHQFFDTTLGKPVWWTGTLWIDALGNPS